MAWRLLRGPLRLPALALYALAAALPAIWSVGGARGQAARPIFAYVVFQPGWNLISAGDVTNLDSPALRSVIAGPLYTLQADDASYESVDLSSLTPGQAYWANFVQDSYIFLRQSAIESYTTRVPAGRCVLVGNPSTRGSARVSGADRVYVFSTALHQFVEESLIGVGRGAWACNGNHESSASVAFQGDVQTLDWPGCCAARPAANGGMARVVFKNDSPAPVIFGLAGMDATGGLAEGQFVAGAHTSACPTCKEYTSHPSCSSGAVDYSLSLPPGDYRLNIASDAPDVPETIAGVTLAPDTTYTVCFFVLAGRR